MRVLGVDPGAAGALAILDTAVPALFVCDMPSSSVQIGKTKRLQISEHLLAMMIETCQPDCAWVERVHSLPKQGVASSFSFGMAYGMVRGILAAYGVRFHMVTPQEWKRSFRLSNDKNEARMTAARMFPANAKDFARVKDDGRAEAALLALFGSQQSS